MRLSYSVLTMLLAINASVLSGCDQIKQVLFPKHAAAAPTDPAFSCSHADNVAELQREFKQSYLQDMQRRLTGTTYQIDQGLLQTIEKNVQFKLEKIRTLTSDPEHANSLECAAELVMILPKGLQQRSENAYAEQQKHCDECDMPPLLTVNLLEDSEEQSPAQLQDDQLRVSVNYGVEKTDREGLVITVTNPQKTVGSLGYMTMLAVQFAGLIAENKTLEQQQAQDQQVMDQQKALAQEAIDVRNKELSDEQSRRVEALNAAWDNLTEAKRAELQDDQQQWFKKRDVDCQIIGQRNISEIPEDEREIYQQKANYWDDAMTEQNQKMQYTKCFNQRTAERTRYLLSLS